MKFAAEIKNSWDHGMIGTALSDWCQGNPSSAAQMIERLRDQNSARLKIINDKLSIIDQLNERIRLLENAKVSIDVSSCDEDAGRRIFGRVTGVQPDDFYTMEGPPTAVRLLCEYESDNFGMRRSISFSQADRS